MATLEELLQKDASLLDTSLYVAQEAARDGLNKNFNIEEYRGIIKEYVDELEKRIANKKDPEEIISEINGFLFKEEGFKYFSSRVPALIFLNKVLDGKEGNCLGLSTLYLVLAEALKLPVYPLLLPRHMALMWDDGKFKRYIETVYKGNSRELEEYIKKYNAITNDRFGEYVRKGSKKSVIASLLNFRGILYSYRKEFLDKALNDLNKALDLDPKYIEAYIARAETYLSQKKYEEAISDLNKALELDPVHLFPDIYDILGRAYALQGKRDIATEYFNIRDKVYDDFAKLKNFF